MYNSGRLQSRSATTPVGDASSGNGRSDAEAPAAVRLDFRNTAYWTDGYGRHICPGCSWRRRINDGTRRLGVNGGNPPQTDPLRRESPGF
jgi:hypothetical protein